MILSEEIYRIFLKIFYHSNFKFEIKYNDFDPKRMDPYILIGNHTSLHDGIFTSMYLKKSPLPVINAFVFVDKFMKFVLTKMYPAIPKRKGQSDIITVRSMMKVLKGGRGVLIFPEGNSSYYGEQSDFPYSTVKFLKKMNLDVVVAKTSGAYLSAPRWGDKRTKRGLVSIEFTTLFKAGEMPDFTLDEVYNKVKEALKFNDFDWNRVRKYEYNPKKRALGLEGFIYLCPKCNSHQTIHTEGNKIFCDNCGEIAHFNKYSLLEGLEFDNLVDWGNLQKKELPRIAKNKLNTTASMFEVDTVKYKKQKLGEVSLSLFEEGLTVQQRLKEYSFTLGKIEGLTLTKKDEVSFDYEDKTYLFKMKDPMLFYDVIKYKNGG